MHSMVRLALNLDDLRSVVQKLTGRGVRIEFVKESLLFTGEGPPLANLMRFVLGAFAEFGRALIGERQREGIALAKSAAPIGSVKRPCPPGRWQNWSNMPLTVKALLNNEIQVAVIFTTSPAIPANKLVVLTDPKNNWLAQQVLPVVKTDKVNDAAKKALNNVSSMLTTEDLIKLNEQVSGAEKMDPAAAAAGWLKDKGITK